MVADVMADKLVTLGEAPKDNYGSGFTANVVCEFRFPTLMELGEARPPASFVKALRRDYPILVKSDEVTISGPQATTTHSHVLRSNRGGWVVSLKESSFSLESKSYPGFKSFRERIGHLVRAAEAVIDADIFTRVGLRYINLVPLGGIEVEGWINPLLTGPVLQGKFQQVSEYAGRMALTAEDGGCLIQHGLRNSASAELIQYGVDIDCYRNDVPLAQAFPVVESLHEQAFEIFYWSMGERAREMLKDKGVG